MGAFIDGQPHAVHTDYLNTARLVTDAKAKPVWQWSYSAFGDNEPSTAGNQFKDDTWIRARAELKDAMDGRWGDEKSGAGKGLVFNMRGEGQYADRESGLVYNLNRSLNAALGRYTQPDLIGLAGGWNRYIHVGSNPLMFTDRMGLQAMPTPLGPMPLPVPTPSPGSWGHSGGYDPIKDLFNPNMSKAQSWPSWPPADPSKPASSGGGGGNCDKQYARDSAICRGMPTAAARAQCWASAADRLAACMAGKNPPPLACN